MDVIHIIHPVRVIIDTLAVLHMVEVENCMVLPVVLMDTILIPSMVNVMVIMVYLLVVMAAIWMIDE